MNDENKKLLTEYMGDCWHEPGDQVSKESPVMQCAKCKKYYHPMSGFRTFTTRSDMMDLYDRLFQKHKWHKFTVFAKMRFSFNDYDQTFTNIETGFYAWLFCLSGEDYESRCQMVADWVKEANHDRN